MFDTLTGTGHFYTLIVPTPRLLAVSTVNGHAGELTLFLFIHVRECARARPRGRVRENPRTRARPR